MAGIESSLLPRTLKNMATGPPRSGEKALVVTSTSETIMQRPAPGTSSLLDVLTALKFNEDLDVVPAEVAAPTGEKQTRKILRAVDDKKNYLPGQPRIRLDDGLFAYLTESHTTETLDELLSFVMRYVFVETPTYDNIKPLHHQGSHAREIKVSENPGLHLVWYNELIFVKPVPAYFYSPAFWEYLENADADANAGAEKRSRLYQACVGFMRSYYLLIKYEIDFERACELRLIPKKGGVEFPTYAEWCEFMVPFSRVRDDQVNRRYHYGELRLARLNRTAFFSKGKLSYFHIFPQWGARTMHILTPILAMFAVCSVFLNAMQVSLNAIAMRQLSPDGQWPEFVAASVWLPIALMIGITFGLVVGLLGVGTMGVLDLVRGKTVRQEEKKDGHQDRHRRGGELGYVMTW